MSDNIFDSINPFGSTPSNDESNNQKESEPSQSLFPNIPFGIQDQEPSATGDSKVSPANNPFGNLFGSDQPVKPKTEEQPAQPLFGGFNLPSNNPFANSSPNNTQPISRDPFAISPTKEPQTPLFSEQPPRQQPIPVPVQPPKPDILDRYDPVKVKQVDETLAKLINDRQIDDIPSLREAFNKLNLPYEAILSKKLSNTGNAALNSDGICDSANAILLGGQELSY